MIWIIGALLVGFAGGWFVGRKFGAKADAVVSAVEQK